MSTKAQRWMKRLIVVISVLVITAIALVLAAKHFLNPQMNNIEFSGSETPNLHNCFWIGPVTYSQFNIAYPDEGAIYWPTVFQIPAGGKLEISADFPKVRYFSYHSYNKHTEPYDNILDEEIQPTNGSNPFITAGATGRYKITVKQEKRPVGRKPDPNVLYLGEAGETVLTPLILRHYVPETGDDLTGGSGLPKVTLVTADGKRLTGQAMCDAVSSPPPGSQKRTISTPTVPKLSYNLLLMLSGNEEGHPARSTPEWFKFWGGKTSLQRIGPRKKFDEAIAKIRSGELPIASGFYANQQAAYISTYISQKFNNVLVIKGKLPKTPASGHDWVKGNYDMRYWSLCTNEGLVTTRFSDCIYDSDVITDDQRNFTVVISTKVNRPANATKECGVNWLDWGDSGDGAGNKEIGLLILRNILPSKAFKPSIQNIPSMDGVGDFMGPYYPNSRYTDRKDFENIGCNDTSS